MREKSGFHINMGVVSLVVIFSVLCLTVFSMLSLSTSVVEKNLAEKTTCAMADYYAADLICTEKTAVIKQLLEEGASSQSIADEAGTLGGSATAGAEGLEIRFSEQIDENRELTVLLVISGKELLVREWKTETTGEWQPDDTITVWKG